VPDSGFAASCLKAGSYRMLDICFQFKSVSNLLLVAVLGAACVFWVYWNIRQHKRLSLFPFIAAGALIFIAWGCAGGIDRDETEHLHCAWMVAQGMIPFRDFWQHHSPLAWLAMSPLFKIIKPTASIIEISRLAAGLIFAITAAIGWKIARKVWRGKAGISLYALLFLSTGVLGEFLCLRPDTFMNLFLMAGLYFSLSMPGRRLLPSVLAGAAFSLALTFTFKQYLLFFLPVIILFLERDKRLALKLFLYCLGAAAGIIPLAVYLVRSNITHEFFFWVFTFNKHNITTSVTIPFIIGIIGLWGARQLYKRFRDTRDLPAAALCSAFCLSLLSSFSGTIGSYYLGFWFLLCAILGSGDFLLKLPDKIPSLLARSLLIGGFLSFLLAPNFIHASSHLRTVLREDKKVLSRLVGYCTGDSFVGILPMHPVFCRDATRLYSEWQFEYAYGFPEIKNDIRNPNIAEQIIASRPAVIQNTYRGRDFFLDLYQKNLISKKDIQRLSPFLVKEYRAARIGRDIYYVRTDISAGQEAGNEQ
jgi:hypothetical protein